MSAPRLLIGSSAAMRAEPPLDPPDEQDAPSCLYCDGSGVILEGDTERPCGSCYEPLDDDFREPSDDAVSVVWP